MIRPRSIWHRLTWGFQQRQARRLVHKAGLQSLLSDAEEYASSLGHSYVGTEHVLVVLLRRMDVADPIRASDADVALRQLVGTSDRRLTPPFPLTPSIIKAFRIVRSGVDLRAAILADPENTATKLVDIARR